jgi:hypothetical protein
VQLRGSPSGGTNFFAERPRPLIAKALNVNGAATRSGARALGIEVPPHLLATPDTVIEGRSISSRVMSAEMRRGRDFHADDRKYPVSNKRADFSFPRGQARRILRQNN